MHKTRRSKSFSSVGHNRPYIYQEPESLDEDEEKFDFSSLNIRLMCKGCRNPIPNLIEDFASGDLVCGDCGLVLSDHIVDTRNDRRYFGSSDYDMLSHICDYGDPRLRWHTLSSTSIESRKCSEEARRLREIMSITEYSNVDRFFITAYDRIETISVACGLPRIIAELSKHIFKRAYDLSTLNTDKMEIIIAASIFVACRQQGISKTFKELSTMLNIPLEKLGKGYKSLVKALEKEPKKVTSYHSFMDRFCSLLHLPPRVQCAASKVASNAKVIPELTDKHPNAIDAGAILFVSKLCSIDISWVQISEVTRVSWNNIQYIYNIMVEEKMEVLRNVRLPVEIDLKLLA